MTTADTSQHVRLIAKLSEAAASLEADDLAELAEIHGWCEKLVDSAAAGSAAKACARQIARSAEALIMGTEDPAATLQTLRRDAASLAASASAHPPDALSPAAATTFAEGSAGARLVRQLAEAATSIDRDNLPGLAKMHGWCQEWAGLVAPDGEAPDAATFARLKTLGATLEGLILGTIDDTEGALATVQETAAALAGNVGATPPPADATLGDAEVAARLANVFEAPDEITASDAAAAPHAESPPPPAAAPAGDSEASYVPEPLCLDAKELEFVGAFIEEAAEHIEAIEAALLEVEQAPTDTDRINELFRPFHTIKGMAGFLNLRDVNALTHEVETVLDQGRRGDRAMTPGTIDLVFEVIDILKAQVAAIGTYVNAPTGGAVPQPPVAAMIARLRGVIARRIRPDEGTRARRASAGAEATTAPAAPERAVPPDAPGEGQEAGRSPAGGAAKAASGEQSVRIDTQKLDALVDLVGELVIAHTLVAANAKIASDPKLNKDAGQVGKIVREVQEVAMSMRMVPIKSTFQKMARLVRDLSRKANKKVELTISGEETELDKNVIQQIGDPLVHMVRNAVDHGIEPPDQRRAAEKPECGRVHLNAFHQSGNIVIEISDDGKGLDSAALFAKAVEKGIVAPDAELTEEQAYQLVFAPGFSTAAVITDISGRGVGMDVVKRNIESLRGRVDITSEKGRGSRFSIRLPLTLAIIDGMLVRIGQERFIIATTGIEQAFRPQPAQITTVHNRGEVVQVRGRLLPLIQLGPLFNLTRRVDPCAAMVIVVHTEAGQVGLVVDELIGQQQVVIKPLGERFRNLRGVSGGAILGDGRVGLILDPSGVRAAFEDWRTRAIVHREDQTPGLLPADVAADRPVSTVTPSEEACRGALALV